MRYDCLAASISRKLKGIEPFSFCVEVVKFYGCVAAGNEAAIDCMVSQADYFCNSRFGEVVCLRECSTEIVRNAVCDKEAGRLWGWDDSDGKEGLIVSATVLVTSISFGLNSLNISGPFSY